MRARGRGTRLTSPDTVSPRELERVLAHRRQALEPLQLLLLPHMYRRETMPQTLEVVASAELEDGLPDVI